MSEKSMLQDTAEDILGEFVNLCDEYLICLEFSARGIEAQAEALRKRNPNPSADQKIWIATDTQTEPKYHARMNVRSLLEKSCRNGYFTSELAKALLCTIYSLWEVLYRHRIANAVAHEVEEIVCPLMGDLRRIRHCVLHNNSMIPVSGLSLEVIPWSLEPGSLTISIEMFREFTGLVRGAMNIQALFMTPRMKAIYQRMKRSERDSFDAWYKNFENRRNDIAWPGLAAVEARLGLVEVDESLTPARDAGL